MAVGIPWCRQKDYDAFCAIFEDRRDLPVSWYEFVQRAHEAEKLQRAQGGVAERVFIDPNTFPNWCAENGYRANANARATFANRIATSRISTSSGTMMPWPRNFAGWR